MAETAQKYIQRMLGNVEGKDALTVQKQTAKRLEKAISRLSKKKLMQAPAAGKWSIAEILAHMADAEWVLGWRMRSALANSGCSIQSFDQNSWATTFQYAKQDPKESLVRFRALREANLALLRGLSKEQWECYGMHQERGKETIAHMMRMIAGHDVNHVAQIEAIAKAAQD
jgi:uncharacterized damage-inducible protein DinB